jgi:hypothetical protein
MPNTGRGYPYPPETGVVPNGAAQMQALAEAINADVDAVALATASNLAAQVAALNAAIASLTAAAGSKSAVMSGSGIPIPNNTWTEIVNWTLGSNMTLSATVGASGLTVTPASHYDMNCNVQWDQNSAGRRGIAWSFGGIRSTSAQVMLPAVSGSPVAMNGPSRTLYASAGTRFSIFVFQDSGSTLNVATAEMSVSKRGV